MKSILLVVLFLSLAFAQQNGLPSKLWSGSTLGLNTTWLEPYWYDGSCSNSTLTNSTYLVIPTNFTTTAVRQVLAMAESNNYIDVLVYNGTFNPDSSASCNNLQQALGSTTSSYSNGPQIDDFFLFQAGVQYTIVVSVPVGSEGQFALNIFDPIATGSNVGNPTWTTTYLNPTCSESNAAPYASFSWTQSTTGLFEVVGAFSYNETASFGLTYLAVFQGNLTNSQITGDICASSLVIVNAYYESSTASRLYGLSLVAGQTYTAVLSGQTTNDFSNYGFYVYPSRVHVANFDAQGFAQPDNSTGTCQSDDYADNNSWVAQAFPAPFYNALIANAYLNDYQYAGNYTTDSSYTYVYTGINNGSSTTAPSSCNGLYALNEKSSTFAIATSAGQTYTVVTTYYSWSESIPTPPQIKVYLVFLLTGNPVGNLNFVPSTTGGSGSGPSSTNTGGSGLATGTHGAASTTFNITTTSAASGLVSSFLFVLVALVATLMF